MKETILSPDLTLREWPNGRIEFVEHGEVVFSLNGFEGEELKKALMECSK